MAKKVGVYICTGCTIGESLDVPALVEVAQKEYKASVCRTHACLCASDGVETIRHDLGDGAVDGVVIAACSSRAKTDAFAFDGTSIVERVNLREHVAWCQPARHEDTQALAEDYLRMGIVKAQKRDPVEPVTGEVNQSVLVVGGGIAGITAALETAEAGHDVVLVEKEAQLGGFLRTTARRFVLQPPYTELAENTLPEKIQAVCSHPRVRVHTSTSIAKIEGQPGAFDVTLRNGGDPMAYRVGAIVMATGWRPYDATRLAHLGYGTSPDIVTNVELEEMLARGPVVRPSDGKRLESVAFIQCAGSRDPAHLPYCSSACCLATLKHASLLHQQDAELKVFIVYKDVRTPGQYERFYRAAQDHPLNFLTKGEVTRVEGDPSGRVRVHAKDTFLGERIEIGADLVVLATGMVPNAADGEAIRALEDAKLRVLKGESETQRAEAARRVETLKVHEGTEILHLTYRQGSDLPVLQYGFPDSHFICFPYETRRSGIYAAGAVRAPMDGTRAEEDALGAALKAIQCVKLATEGASVHPRSGDLSYPSFFLQRCTQCKRCTEECPFGTLDEDEKGTPKPNPYRCRRCGVCMGACPERIISFKDYSVDMIASMIKAIEVPGEDEEKPRVLLLMCENDAYPALDIVGTNHQHYDPSVRVIPLRCLGSTNIVWIADALSRGFDGVMLVGCKYGDDYQCHFVKGSELANRRLENVKETLQRLRLESERIELVQLALNEHQRLPALIDAFVGRIREIGPNPYKDL